MCVQARPLREIAAWNARIGRYCDHAEHNEAVELAWILDSGAGFRDLAVDLATELGIDLREAWAQRLERIEHRPLAALLGDFDGPKEAGQTLTWADVQRVQDQHDRTFHSDVFGMSRTSQLRHFAFHCMKLGELPAMAASGMEVGHKELRPWLADVLIFGVKLATVMGVALPSEPVSGFTGRSAGLGGQAQQGAAARSPGSAVPNSVDIDSRSASGSLDRPV